MPLLGPKIKPQQFGAKSNDSHLIANAQAKTIKAYNVGTGKLLWECPALLDGQHANWRVSRGDTPPGLYKIGAVWGKGEDAATLMAYGWRCFDLVDLEGNEDDYGRAGVAIHGGGTGLGYNGSQEANQPLLPTHGCIRMHNADLDKITSLLDNGAVFVSVYQDEV